MWYKTEPKSWRRDEAHIGQKTTAAAEASSSRATPCCFPTKQRENRQPKGVQKRKQARSLGSLRMLRCPPPCQNAAKNRWFPFRRTHPRRSLAAEHLRRPAAVPRAGARGARGTSRTESSRLAALEVPPSVCLLCCCVRPCEQYVMSSPFWLLSGLCGFIDRLGSSVA